MISVLSYGATLQTRPAPPPPPTTHPPNIQQHLSDLYRKLQDKKAVNVSAQRALQYASRYLTKADTVYHGGHQASAERLAAAANSFLHVAEHQEHLVAGGGPPIPPAPAEIEDHLQRVYFRTQQSDYFLAHSQDSVVASELPGWERGFYGLARRAFDRKEWIVADENAKCAEVVVKALENLAQAANIKEAPVPPPRPQKPPPL